MALWRWRNGGRKVRTSESIRFSEMVLAWRESRVGEFGGGGH